MKKVALLIAAAMILAPTLVSAQIVPSKESLADLYHGKVYSPYAQRSFPDKVFWDRCQAQRFNVLV